MKPPIRAIRAGLRPSLGRAIAALAAGSLLLAACSSTAPTASSSNGAPWALATLQAGPVRGPLAVSTPPATSSTPPTTHAAVPSAPPPTRTTATSKPAPTRVVVPNVSAAQRSSLPVADTYGHIRRARIDPHTRATGKLVHVARDTVAFRAPGGTPVAVIPSKQVGVDTWLPVIAARPGWLEVRLPSRPNGVVAWVPAHGIPTKSTTYRVTVSLHTGVLAIRHGRQTLGHWQVAYGRPSLPTPTTRTFVMTRFHDPKQSFSPVIFALGAHSDAMASFEGGPGTIAIHGWPTYAGRHGGASHGCVRVPDAALNALRKVPNGTPVDITR